MFSDNDRMRFKLAASRVFLEVPDDEDTRAYIAQSGNNSYALIETERGFEVMDEMGHTDAVLTNADEVVAWLQNN